MPQDIAVLIDEGNGNGREGKRADEIVRAATDGPRPALTMVMLPCGTSMGAWGRFILGEHHFDRGMVTSVAQPTKRRRAVCQIYTPDICIVTSAYLNLAQE